MNYPMKEMKEQQEFITYSLNHTVIGFAWTFLQITLN